MTLEELKAELAAWQDDAVAAAMIEQERLRLQGMVNNPLVNVYLRGGCLKTLINLDTNEEEFRNRKIAAYEQRIAQFGQRFENQPIGGP